MVAGGWVTLTASAAGAMLGLMLPYKSSAVSTLSVFPTSGSAVLSVSSLSADVVGITRGFPEVSPDEPPLVVGEMAFPLLLFPLPEKKLLPVLPSPLYSADPSPSSRD